MRTVVISTVHFNDKSPRPPHHVVREAVSRASNATPAPRDTEDFSREEVALTITSYETFRHYRMRDQQQFADSASQRLTGAFARLAHLEKIQIDLGDPFIGAKGIHESFDNLSLLQPSEYNTNPLFFTMVTLPALNQAKVDVKEIVIKDANTSRLMSDINGELLPKACQDGNIRPWPTLNVRTPTSLALDMAFEGEEDPEEEEEGEEEEEEEEEGGEELMDEQNEPTIVTRRGYEVLQRAPTLSLPKLRTLHINLATMGSEERFGEEDLIILLTRRTLSQTPLLEHLRLAGLYDPNPETLHSPSTISSILPAQPLKHLKHLYLEGFTTDLNEMTRFYALYAAQLHHVTLEYSIFAQLTDHEWLDILAAWRNVRWPNLQQFTMMDGSDPLVKHDRDIAKYLKRETDEHRFVSLVESMAESESADEEEEEEDDGQE